MWVGYIKSTPILAGLAGLSGQTFNRRERIGWSLFKIMTKPKNGTPKYKKGQSFGKTRVVFDPIPKRNMIRTKCICCGDIHNTSLGSIKEGSFEKCRCKSIKKRAETRKSAAGDERCDPMNKLLSKAWRRV